jgi:hypothetical protein
MALTKAKASNILLTTPAASSNDVTPATTEYVTTALANMVDSAPSTLNTLNELAAALGDDANFSTTVTNSIAGKLPLAGGTMTGNLTLNGADIVKSGSADLTIDVGGRIDLSADDNGEVRLYDGSSLYAQFKDDDDRLRIQTMIQDKDMMFVGNDGGSEVTALFLDMSNGGRANFNNDIGLNDDRGVRFGSNDDSVIYNDGSNLYIKNSTLNHDIIFQGNDDGSAITALTLDMSLNGNATFNKHISHTTTNATHYFGSNQAFSSSPAIGRAGGNNFHISGTITGDLAIGGESGQSIVFGTSPSGGIIERMRIENNGIISLGNSTNRRPFAVQSSLGYASTYKTTIIGSTSTGYNTNITGSTSICFNYDPSGNTNGSFAGVGGEIWFRRSTTFKTPNSADNAYFTQFSMTDGVTSGDFNDTSDRNLKENITSITNGYDVIKDLNPVTFDWKDANKGNGLGGFIAQEVEIVLPNDVLGEDYAEGDRGQPLTDGKSINTTSIVAHLVKAVQELKAENDSLKARIETLEG